MSHRLRPHLVPLPPGIDVPRLLDAWRGRPGLVALDGAGGAPTSWSWVGVDPLRALPTPVDLAGVRALARRVGFERAVPGPFQGGFLGALAYDLGVADEALTLPRAPGGLPPVVGGAYVDFAVLDRSRGAGWLVAGGDPGDGRAPCAERGAELLAALERTPDGAAAWGVGPLVRHVPPALHAARVERVRALIAAGELYQANLAHRFSRGTRGHPVDLYRALRAANPAPYGAYLAWGQGADGRPAGALLSASPELLLEADGARLRTRPIKGTVGRGATPAEDARARGRLLASAKERAELAMIVDLERNDLARVARPGSVAVRDFATLESYAAVHHLVADVEALLRPGLDGGDALAALFPGGSISGAPKLRALEAIAELEGEGRGFFSGSLGFLDGRGGARFNILIRTLVWRPCGDGAPAEADGEVGFHVGGGITWGSDPALEERETLYKGAALAAALAAPGEPPDTLGLDLPGLAAGGHPTRTAPAGANGGGAGAT